MFKFKSIDQVNAFGSTITKEYHGFTAQLCPTRLKDNIVVIAWCCGESDFWIVDPNDEGIEQLQEYYDDMIGEVPTFTLLKEVE